MNPARAVLITMAALFAIVALQATNAMDAEAAALIKSVRLTVPEANCASAGAEADTLLRGIEGVTEVDVDIESTTADIIHDPSKTSIESIKEIMKAGGYPVTAVEVLKR
jgi:copper chaperone CopZ